MANDIAIIGVGLHPFGRHEHVYAIDMGVAAARQAMADAGVQWSDVQVGYAGSLSVMMPETMVKFLGLTGVPFSKLFNGCATGGNLLLNTINAIRASSRRSVRSTASTSRRLPRCSGNSRRSRKATRTCSSGR